MRRPLCISPTIVLALAWFARAGHVDIDFRNGPPPPTIATISPLTLTSHIDYAGGALNVSLPNAGDAVQITPTIFNPACFVFNVPTIGLPDQGALGFEVTNGDAQNSVSLGLGLFGQAVPPPGGGPSPAGLPVLIEVKLYRTTETNGQSVTDQPFPPVSTLLTADQYNNISDIKYIRIDCLGNGKIDVEFHTGLFHFNYAVTVDDPGVCNGGSLTGRIRNLSGVIDPPTSASISSVSLDTTHVPEPSSLLLCGFGGLALIGTMWLRRERITGG